MFAESTATMATFSDKLDLLAARLDLMAALLGEIRDEMVRSNNLTVTIMESQGVPR